MKLVEFDPQKLAVHKSLALMPAWEDGDQRFLALCDDVKENGVREPLKVYIPSEPRSDGKVAVVVDGRHRQRASKRMQLPAVPCIVVDEQQAAGIIIATLLHRRHYSKSALAYLAFPFLKTAYDEANARRLGNLKRGMSPANSAAKVFTTVGQLADQLGISERMFQYAAQVNEIFENDSEYKKIMEPAILSDDPEESVALSRVVAGYAGRKTTAGKARPATQQLELFCQGTASLAKFSSYWEKLDAEDQAQAKLEVRKTAVKMPADLRAIWIAELKRADKGQE